MMLIVDCFPRWWYWGQKRDAKRFAAIARRIVAIGNILTGFQ
jgi:hypothetical protein